MSHLDDPYAAPPSDAAVERPRRSSLVQAERWRRLVAYFVDMLLYAPALFAYAAGTELSKGAEDAIDAKIAVVVFAVLAGATLAVVAIQVWHMQSNGWSMGKRLLGVRVVDLDGGKPGLVRGYLLRFVLPTILCLVPCAGCIFSVLDSLFIFTPSARCLHDMLAGTKVVKA